MGKGFLPVTLVSLCEEDMALPCDGYQLIYFSELRKVAPNEEELWVILLIIFFVCFRNAVFPWLVMLYKPGFGLMMTIELN